MWRTSKLTTRIGIEFPIIQAPMAGDATTPELVAAVSNSGGLGSLGAGYMSPDEMRLSIRKIRELTDKPFAVNLFIPAKYHVTADQMQKACNDINQSCSELNLEIEPVSEPYTQSFEEQIQIIIEEKIAIFSYTFGTLHPSWISQLQKNHAILIGTATTLAEALLLEKSGIDIIVAQGSEAGGHRGTFLGQAEDALIGLVSLIPQLIDQVKIPIVASGGIMDGRGISASIDLGAAGVQMGTAFLTCFESGIPDHYKQNLLEQREDNSVLTRAFSGKLARGIRNKFIDRMDSNTENILEYPIQNKLTTTMRKMAKEKNNIDFMSMWAGQSAQLCRQITASELITALVNETDAVYCRVD